MVNEPSMFEPPKFYCILLVYNAIKPEISDVFASIPLRLVSTVVGRAMNLKALHIRYCCCCCTVVVLLFYAHGKHLRSCRDGQLT